MSATTLMLCLLRLYKRRSQRPYIVFYWGCLNHCIVHQGTAWTKKFSMNFSTFYQLDFYFHFHISEQPISWHWKQVFTCPLFPTEIPDQLFSLICLTGKKGVYQFISPIMRPQCKSLSCSLICYNIYWFQQMSTNVSKFIPSTDKKF